jgi:UDP-glucose:(heptosyl)LPS alpha-1,3-glucosyltransferase
VKILIVARPFAFHGGIERATAGLLRALIAHGHDVHLLSPGPPPAVPGLTLARLRLPPLPGAARLVVLAVAVRMVVARRRWDVVQSHERTLGQDVYRAGEGCHRAYLQSRDPVDRPRSTAPGDPRSTARREGRYLYHRVLLALERRVLTVTPRLVAIARRGKDEIERLYRVDPARIAVVYNGVDLERFHPRNRALHRRSARTEIGVPDDAWLNLFVGSGFARKGLATAVEALATGDDDRSRLVVVGRGDGHLYETLARRLGVGERVAWLGPRPDVERWYAAADALVLPARYEPFGNVHLEALASGVPVVTSTDAGGAEVIEEGVNGAVREPHDAAGFGEALARLRQRPAAEAAHAARRSAEPYTYAAQVAALEKIYRSVEPRRPDFP